MSFYKDKISTTGVKGFKSSTLETMQWFEKSSNVENGTLQRYLYE
jgi:hypothetical protein